VPRQRFDGAGPDPPPSVCGPQNGDPAIAPLRHGVPSRFSAAHTPADRPASAAPSDGASAGAITVTVAIGVRGADDRPGRWRPSLHRPWRQAVQA